MKQIASLLLCLLALLCSCEQAKDDYRYPSVVTDYACLITDATGYAEQLLLDDGCIMGIEEIAVLINDLAITAMYFLCIICNVSVILRANNYIE